MPLSEDAARAVVVQLLKMREAEKARLDRIYSYVRNKTCNIYVPRSATQEYRQLVDMARVNVLPLVPAAFAQNLAVEGYRPHRASENADAWRTWQANRMDARQAGIYRSSLTYGTSYATVLPGRPQPVIRPFSPRSMTAAYEDPINDEWPIYGLAVTDERDARAKPIQRMRLYDDTTIYEFEGSPDAAAPTFLGSKTHDLGICPIVRWCSEYDLDDGSLGEVEPLLPLQDQLFQTTFGLLMAQQFAAFRQRWATGMAIAEDEHGRAVEPFNAAVNRVWQNESPDGKFGDFAETNLSGYLESRKSTLQIIASLTQLPPHTLVISDGIANISAEALAAIEAGMRRKGGEQKTTFGESDEQMLRLCAKAAGDPRGWEDDSAQVVWRDTESRSLAQVADALGKMATMLAVPPRALWERIPGVTDQDIGRWERIAEEDGGLATLTQLMQQENSAQRGRESADTPAPV